MELVSIVVPVYKVEEFLEKCVESILRQTYKNLEIILVDDGSPDNSGKICEELSEKDGRVKVYHKENGGLSSARNFGIEKANGKYICFIDSDDVISSDFVEYLLFLIQKNNCDVAVGEYERFTDCEPSFGEKDAKIEVVEGKNAIDKLFGKSYITATIACNKLYKKSLFDDLRFPVGLINEDEAVAYRIYYKTKRVVFSEKVVYGYYTRIGSITKSPFSKKNFDFLQISEERCNFFKSNNEDRYYSLFLIRHCWNLLEFAKKTKKILRDYEKSKELVDEFKEKSILLVKSPYISRAEKIGLVMIRKCPQLFFIAKKIKQIKKRK